MRLPQGTRLPVLLTVLAFLAGVGYRLGLMIFDAPPTNSDEATMGLAALHISRGQEFPVWFYGQSYMGTLEAWLAAPLFAVAGPSTLGLRLPTLAMYALFVLLIWRLTLRLTGDRWFALLVVGLLALGSDRIVKNQLIAGGGYPEMNVVGAALALLAYGLATGRPGHRLPRWTVWGFLAGLMLWVDPLVLPYVAGTGLVLVAFRWRELRGRAGALLALGALIGAAPLLVDSLVAGRNPLAAVLTASGAEQSAGWADRLHGGLVLGPALGMGFCDPGRCAGWQLWWTAALPVLLIAAALTALHTLRTHRPTHPDPATSTLSVFGPTTSGTVTSGQVTAGTAVSRTAASGPVASRAVSWGAGGAGAGTPARVGAAVALALVGAAVATMAAYTVSSAAGRTPVESARYLSCLLISVPVLLWPLWTAARRRRLPTDVAPDLRLAGRRAATAQVAAVVVLTATLGTATVATAGTVSRISAVHADERRHTALVAALRERGVRHVYGTYWTCNRLTFASAEDVVCAVVDDNLRPGHDRYRPYREAVRAAAAPAWVAPAGSPLAARLDQRPGSLDLLTVEGWHVYLPRA
ncbi:hypothetical protein AB0M35_21240 [Micromonospora sp. NPDC051196]|uniref:hypothetical protein n=1 Tax=Micromonospora sp. NPDC051196 TaxID=3155281 RepID=UPI00342D0DAF